MSQDQVYHLMVGLALIKRFVPPQIAVKGRALRAWAIEQGQRIGEHFAKGLWVIKNPVVRVRPMKTNVPHRSVSSWCSDSRVRLRVISTRPSSEILVTLARARSTDSALLN